MDDNTVHIGTDESATGWRRFARRSVVIPLLALVFVGVGAWVVTNMNKKSEEKETRLDSAIKASDAAFDAGNYEDSLKHLEEVSDQAGSKEDKLKMYSDMAAAAASAGKMDKAMEYLEQKHKLDANSVKEDAYLMGSYYESAGNNQKAVEYYKIALEYKKAQPKSGQRDADIESLNVRIESLEAQ